MALKLLSSELTRDPVMRERFVREAQATNSAEAPQHRGHLGCRRGGQPGLLVMEF
nr:hypothetical protein [Deltaproteobacteria bacterium]